ncbi:MAG: hypothetical protein ABW061_10445, partial [Polyangiaceae bacterium]
MELDSQLLGPALTGVGALLLGWLAFGKSRSKPAPAAVAREVPAPEVKQERPKRPAPRPDSNPTLPAAKAIVWTAPQAGLDDEDITVVHVIPVFGGAEEIAMEATSVSIEAASVTIEGETEEEQVSRVELSYEQDAEVEEVTSASARILLYAAGDSDQGRVRKRNEDSLLVMPERSLFAVADGMGGHRGGAVASSLAIDALQDAFDRSAF